MICCGENADNVLLTLIYILLCNEFSIKLKTFPLFFIFTFICFYSEVLSSEEFRFNYSDF